MLAVIVGIGSTLFSQFTSSGGNQPTIENAMALVPAALKLLGLGIFGLELRQQTSGGPHQLGAAVGTTMAAGGGCRRSSTRSRRAAHQHGWRRGEAARS